MNIMFGVFRLPSVGEYWHAESWVRGGIETCMPEGRYRFIENNLLVFSDETEQQRALHLCNDIRRKWRKIYRPDQELVLWRQTYRTHTTFYLLDSETLFVLDEAVVFAGQGSESVEQVLLTFAAKNHVLHFSFDALSLAQVVRLAESAQFAVGECAVDSQVADDDRAVLALLAEEDTLYATDKLCMVRNGGRVLVFPRRRIRLDTAAPNLP